MWYSVVMLKITPTVYTKNKTPQPLWVGDFLLLNKILMQKQENKIQEEVAPWDPYPKNKRTTLQKTWLETVKGGEQVTVPKVFVEKLGSLQDAIVLSVVADSILDDEQRKEKYEWSGEDVWDRADFTMTTKHWEEKTGLRWHEIEESRNNLLKLKLIYYRPANIRNYGGEKDGTVGNDRWGIDEDGFIKMFKDV